jgi:hypothetical protein
MEIKELLFQGMELVNELAKAIEVRGIGLEEVEERILEYVNRIGALMVQEVVDRAKEPLVENRVYVEGEEAVYGVAVGMLVSQHPLHRSVRALLTHTAPTSSIWRRSALRDKGELCGPMGVDFQGIG